MQVGESNAMAEGDGKAVEGSPKGPPQPHQVLGDAPIAPGLGIDYGFPPHLEYAYPPPDGNILTNMVNALIAVPRFYTQVLHLMNKMNLPAPFRPAMPTPPLPPAPTQLAPKRQVADLSSGESELESSDEDEDSDQDGSDMNMLVVEKKIGKKGPVNKRVKRGSILGPALDKGATHEAAGLKNIIIPTAPKTIKKKTPVLQIKITPKDPTSEVEPDKSKGEETHAEPSEATSEQPATSSREELEAGKLQSSDMLSIPLFKKYSPGSPTPVLYIKNLAKDVVPEDMYYIFGAFFSSRTEAMEQLSVKVMQEGRMRGQAFVYWPSTELAKVALAGTHGFVFKGKPMIVQYGRNQAAAKTTATEEHIPENLMEREPGMA